MEHRAIAPQPLVRFARERSTGRRSLPLRWVLGTLGVLLLAILFVVLTDVRPAYDAYGWLVWGRQAAHLKLNTSAAPSWKPLPFLFTLPYALAGRDALWLWMVTATAGAFAAPIFAGRLAYRLCGPDSLPRYARLTAAGFAAAGVLGIVQYWHFVLISYADPLIVALCLAAIDCHFCGRRRVTWLLLVLTALGRPEVWPAAAIYAAWAWRAIPSARLDLAAGAAAVPLLWFGIPALTSPSWKIAGDVALYTTDAISGNKLAGLLHRFVNLYELPMQLAVLSALVLAVGRRERRWLALAGAALLWLLVDLYLALQQYSPAPRYMYEPAAVMIVLAGSAIGWVIGTAPRRVVLRWVGILAIAGLVVTLAPHARIRARLAHNEIIALRSWARQIKRLHRVIAAEGGPKRILACGAPVTEVSYQSILAWEIGENVADVGWDPPSWISGGKPIVLFEPDQAGWHVRPIHTHGAACSALARDTDLN
jgi:hypothetical protein